MTNQRQPQQDPDELPSAGRPPAGMPVADEGPTARLNRSAPPPPARQVPIGQVPIGQPQTGQPPAGQPTGQPPTGPVTSGPATIGHLSSDPAVGAPVTGAPAVGAPVTGAPAAGTPAAGETAPSLPADGGNPSADGHLRGHPPAAEPPTVPIRLPGRGDDNGDEPTVVTLPPAGPDRSAPPSQGSGGEGSGEPSTARLGDGGEPTVTDPLVIDEEPTSLLWDDRGSGRGVSGDVARPDEPDVDRVAPALDAGGPTLGLQPAAADPPHPLAVDAEQAPATPAATEPADIEPADTERPPAMPADARCAERPGPSDPVISARDAGAVPSGESPVPSNDLVRPSDPDGPAAVPGVNGGVQRSWRKLSSAAALIWVLLALFGFTLVVQLRSNDTNDGLATARQEDLVRILSDLEARDTRLSAEISALEQSQRQLTSGVAGRQAALAEADKRADELGLLAGTLPGRGPGLRIVIDPKNGAVKASAVLNAVQELRGSGGEVMELVGRGGTSVRVVASTYFVDAGGGGILVDGARLNGPYTLWVIGSPQTMQTALQIPGGVVASVEGAGGSVTMEQRSLVEVTAVRKATTLQYARPVS